MPSIYSIAFKTLLIGATASRLAAAYPTGGNVIYDGTGDNSGSLQTPEVSIDNNVIQLKNGDTFKLDKPVLNNRDVNGGGNVIYDGSNGFLQTPEVSIDNNVIKLKNGDTVKLDNPVLNTRDANDENDKDDDGDVLYDGTGYNSGDLETSKVSINDNVIRLKNGDTVKLDKPVLNARAESDDQDEDDQDEDVEDDEDDEDEDAEGQ